MLTWRAITCAQADYIRTSRDLHPSGGYTDLTGFLCGEPEIGTEWAPLGSEIPVLRNIRYPQHGGGRPDRRPCEHYTTLPEAEPCRRS